MEEPKGSGNLLYDGSHRRLVLYIGPAKTGSTTLQKFLAKYANRNSSTYVKAMEDWNYPIFFGEPGGIRSLLVDKKSAQRKEVRTEFQHQTALNLVVASEFLMTRSHQYLQFAEWSNVTNLPEIVIHSRTPRFSHLTSLWKQHSQNSKRSRFYGWSFKRYVCFKNTTDFLSILMTTFNPIGAAHSILNELQLPVYMMNMAGVEEQGMDIAHAFACTILQVNCTDGNKWVEGIPRKSKRENVRSGDAGVSDEQIDRINNVFRQLDCAYEDDVNRHPLFRLFYETSETWPHCCSTVQAMPVYRQKPILMLEEIRRIMECPRSDHDGENHTTPNSNLLSQDAANNSLNIECQLHKSRAAVNDIPSLIVVTEGSLTAKVQLPSNAFSYFILPTIVGLFFFRGKTGMRTAAHRGS